MFLQNGDTLDLALGIGGDNFFADSTPVNLTVSASGDFDGSQQYNCEDVDALVGVIVAGTYVATFDLDGDGLVNGTDLTRWLAAAGAANLPSGNSYLFGDAKSQIDALAEDARQDAAGILPALTWLSLVGLLASRARLRFTRQQVFYL